MNGEPAPDPVQQAAALPLSDRLSHKHWKVREAAYHTLASKFASLTPVDDTADPPPPLPPLLADFSTPLVKTMLRDANAAAQLAAFDAAIKFTVPAPTHLLARLAPEMAKALVEKAFTSRPANKARALDIVVEVAGADAGGIILDALLERAVAHKVPKVVVACVEAVAKVVEAFGCAEGAVPVVAVAKAARALLEHGNGDVRKVTKALLVEMARWVGGAAAMAPLLKDVKDVTLKELEAGFNEHEGQPRPEPKRLTRKAEAAATSAAAGAAAAVVDETPAMEVDFSEAVDLLAKIRAMHFELDESQIDWISAIDSKKWNIRKGALDAVVEAVDGGRIETGDIGEVVSKVRKLIAKDVNVNVAASAAKVVACLASGLKDRMAPAHARVFCVDLLARLKDKNKVLLEALLSALDALHLKRSLVLTDVWDALSANVSHKVPKARELTLVWLHACLGRLGSKELRPMLKDLAAVLLKASEDTTGEVRSEALRCLAQVAFVLGPRMINPVLENLDKIKQEKVTNIVSSLQKSAEPVQVDKDPPAPPAVERVSQKRCDPVTPTAKPTGAAVRVPKGARDTAADSAKSPSVAEVPYMVALSEEDLNAKAADMFPGVSLESLSSKSFKERSDSAESVATTLLEKESANPDEVAVVLSLLGQGSGLEDPNPLAQNSKMRLLQTLVKQTASLTMTELVKSTVVLIVKRLGELKNGLIAKQTLVSVAEASTPQDVVALTVPLIKEQTNPRAVQGLANFLGEIVSDFGIKSVDVSMLADATSSILKSENSAARKAGHTLAVTVGTRLLDAQEFLATIANAGVDGELLEKVRSALESSTGKAHSPTRKSRGSNALLDASPVKLFSNELVSIAQAAESRPPDRTGGPEAMHRAGRHETARRRLSSVTPPKRSISDAGRRVAATEVPTFSANAALKKGVRTDIRAIVPVNITEKLKDREWNRRQDALNKFEVSLRKAQELEAKVSFDESTVRALVARTTDPNRNLVVHAYQVLSLVAVVGADTNAFVKLVLPSILTKGIVDSKKTVQSAAKQCLDSWSKANGFQSVIGFLPLALQIDNSAVRREALEWILPRMPNFTQASDDVDLSFLVTPTLSCLRDKVAEVRQLGEQLLGYVVASVGIGAVSRVARSLPAPQQSKLQPVLDKYGGGAETPVRPVSRRVLHSPGSVKSTSSNRRASFSTGLSPPATGSEKDLKGITRSVDRRGRRRENVEAINGKRLELNPPVSANGNIPRQSPREKRNPGMGNGQSQRRADVAEGLGGVKTEGVPNSLGRAQQSQKRSLVDQVEGPRGAEAGGGSSNRQSVPVAGKNVPESQIDFVTKIEYFEDESPVKENIEDFAARRSVSDAQEKTPPRQDSADEGQAPRSSASEPEVAGDSCLNGKDNELSQIVKPNGVEDRGRSSDEPEHTRERSPKEKALVRDKVLRHLASDVLEERLEGVRLLCDGLQMAESKIYPKVSEIIQALVYLLADAFNAIPYDERSERVVKYVLNGLMQMFKRVAIARGCEHKSLEKLVAQLFACMTNENISMLKDHVQITKALNMLTMKVLENARATDVFTVLVKVCADLLGDKPSCLQKQVELAVKCLLRITKSSLRGFNVSIVLRDMHEFLAAHPPDLVAQNDRVSHDLVFRSLQHVLSELVQIYGSDLRRHMSLIPDHSSSLIAQYLDLMLTAQNGPGAARPRSNLESPQRKTSENGGTEEDVQAKNELRRIFAMIGQRSTSHDGLRELHLFIKCNPSFDIQPHLRMTSTVFQKFIQQGLEMMDQDDDRNARLAHSAMNHPPSVNNTPVRRKVSDGSSGSSDSIGEDYMRKLKEIQERYSQSREGTPSRTPREVLSRSVGAKTPLTEKENRPNLPLSTPTTPTWSATLLEDRLTQLESRRTPPK